MDRRKFISKFAILPGFFVRNDSIEESFDKFYNLKDNFDNELENYEIKNPNNIPKIKSIIREHKKELNSFNNLGTKKVPIRYTYQNRRFKQYNSEVDKLCTIFSELDEIYDYIKENIINKRNRPKENKLEDLRDNFTCIFISNKGRINITKDISIVDLSTIEKHISIFTQYLRYEFFFYDENTADQIWDIFTNLEFNEDLQESEIPISNWSHFPSGDLDDSISIEYRSSSISTGFLINISQLYNELFNSINESKPYKALELLPKIPEDTIEFIDQSK